MNSFHDQRFPLSLAFGATGGPVRANEIIEMVSGREVRNQRQTHAKRRYDAGTAIKNNNDVAVLVEFFEARRGSLHAFRFCDPFDCKSCKPKQIPSALDQPLGVGDGTTTQFQLIKTYGMDADTYIRPITKPVNDSVVVAINGTPILPSGNWSVHSLTGEITFQTPPPSDAIITAGYKFDVPVRFDIDHLSVNLVSFEAGQALSVALVEVLE